MQMRKNVLPKHEKSPQTGLWRWKRIRIIKISGIREIGPGLGIWCLWWLI